MLRSKAEAAIVSACSEPTTRSSAATGGAWEAENRGVAPDFEVTLDPEQVRKGRDPQLEKAVEVVLEEMKKNPPPKLRRPSFPNYQKSAAK